MSKVDLSIIVLNYNTKNTTIDCINSLVPFLSPTIECLVLDNGSTDGFYDEAKKLFSKTKNIVYRHTNRQNYD